MKVTLPIVGPALYLEDYRPSVLVHCWLGHLTCKIVSEMTYNVSSGTLNPIIPYLLQTVRLHFVIQLCSSLTAAAGALSVCDSKVSCNIYDCNIYIVALLLVIIHELAICCVHFLGACSYCVNMHLPHKCVSWLNRRFTQCSALRLSCCEQRRTRCKREMGDLSCQHLLQRSTCLVEKSKNSRPSLDFGTRFLREVPLYLKIPESS